MALLLSPAQVFVQQALLSGPTPAAAASSSPSSSVFSSEMIARRMQEAAAGGKGSRNTTRAQRACLSDLSPLSPFRPRALLTTVLLSMARAFLPRSVKLSKHLDRMAAKLEAGEELSPEDNIPWMELFRHYPRECWDLLAKTLFCTSVQRVGVYTALWTLHDRVTDKLTKNVRASAVRKVFRMAEGARAAVPMPGVATLLLRRTGVAGRLCLTASRGNLLSFLSLAICDTVILLIKHAPARWGSAVATLKRCVFPPRDDAAEGNDTGKQVKKKEPATLAMDLLHMVDDIASMYFCSCVGAALGTLLYPGSGTFLGGLIGEYAGPLLESMLMGEKLDIDLSDLGLAKKPAPAGGAKQKPKKVAKKKARSTKKATKKTKSKAKSSKTASTGTTSSEPPAVVGKKQ